MTKLLSHHTPTRMFSMEIGCTYVLFSSILHSRDMISKLVDHTVGEQTTEQSNLISLKSMTVSKRKRGN